ncbi:MAG: hypothetical protein U5K84_01240 [Alkalibacterium sp.]|nr:hypothetical protein [Alkalibacterium sp.]
MSESDEDEYKVSAIDRKIKKFEKRRDHVRRFSKRSRQKGSDFSCISADRRTRYREDNSFWEVIVSIHAELEEVSLDPGRSPQ